MEERSLPARAGLRRAARAGPASGPRLQAQQDPLCLTVMIASRDKGPGQLRAVGEGARETHRPQWASLTPTEPFLATITLFPSPPSKALVVFQSPQRRNGSLRVPRGLVMLGNHTQFQKLPLPTLPTYLPPNTSLTVTLSGWSSCCPPGDSLLCSSCRDSCLHPAPPLLLAPTAPPHLDVRIPPTAKSCHRAHAGSVPACPADPQHSCSCSR